MQSCTAPIGRRSTKSISRCLPYVGHRADLSYLIAMVGGELTVAIRICTGAGDVPGEDPVSVGLLGADFAIENGRYRIKHIYTGENWNPDLRAPLSAPGYPGQRRRLSAGSKWPRARAADKSLQLVRRHRRTADADPRGQEVPRWKARGWSP